MEIKEHYNVDFVTDTIIRPGLSLRVVSGDAKLRECPECCIPLRDIHCYNRIMKRALLDESTECFIVKASSTYQKLVGVVQERELELADREKFLQSPSQSGTFRRLQRYQSFHEVL